MRALKRQEEADSAVAIAQQSLELAQMTAEMAANEVKQLRDEVILMESSIIVTNADSAVAVDQLHAQLANVLQHLRANASVDPSLITLAESHSSQLLEGFRKTFSAAEEEKDNCEEVKVKNRIRGKQARQKPILPKSIVKRARIMTKRTPKNVTLGDFFTHMVSQANANKSQEGL